MSRREVEPTTEFGKQLERARRSRGLTKQAWIDMLDVSKPAYLGWLRGAKPDVTNIFEIARVLDREPTEVFFWVAADHAKGVYLNSLSRPALVAA